MHGAEDGLLVGLDVVENALIVRQRVVTVQELEPVRAYPQLLGHRLLEHIEGVVGREYELDDLPRAVPGDSDLDPARGRRRRWGRGRGRAHP